MAHDAGAYGRLFARDAQFVDVEHRSADRSQLRTFSGRAEIEELCTAWLATVGSFSYEVLDVIEQGDRAAKRWRYIVDGEEFEGITWLDCRVGEIIRALVMFDSYRLYESGTAAPADR